MLDMLIIFEILMIRPTTTSPFDLINFSDKFHYFSVTHISSVACSVSLTHDLP